MSGLTPTEGAGSVSPIPDPSQSSPKPLPLDTAKAHKAAEKALDLVKGDPPTVHRASRPSTSKRPAEQGLNLEQTVEEVRAAITTDSFISFTYNKETSEWERTDQESISEPPSPSVSESELTSSERPISESESSQDSMVGREEPSASEPRSVAAQRSSPKPAASTRETERAVEKTIKQLTARNPLKRNKKAALSTLNNNPEVREAFEKELSRLIKSARDPHDFKQLKGAVRALRRTVPTDSKNEVAKILKNLSPELAAFHKQPNHPMANELLRMNYKIGESLKGRPANLLSKVGKNLFRKKKPSYDQKYDSITILTNNKEEIANHLLKMFGDDSQRGDALNYLERLADGISKPPQNSLLQKVCNDLLDSLEQDPRSKNLKGKLNAIRGLIIPPST